MRIDKGAFTDTFYMGYFNYHATAKRLIREGKLVEYRFLEKYHGIKDVLLLIFNDPVHPVMPIRRSRWEEYFSLLNIKPNIKPKEE